MTKYKNTGGIHQTNNGDIKHGEIFESNDPDLMKKFPNKFERVLEEATAQTAITTPQAKKTEVQKAAEAGAEGIKADVQDDVTKDFPKAKAAGLVVRRDKGGWWIFDGDEEAANEKPLKKREVNQFIKEYLEE